MLTRSRKGFTLLELIVVLVVLGLLAAIAIPTYAAVIAKAEKKGAVESAKSAGRDIQALSAFDRVSQRNSAFVTTADTESQASIVEASDFSTTGNVNVTLNSQTVCLTLQTTYSANPTVSEAVCP